MSNLQDCTPPLFNILEAIRNTTSEAEFKFAKADSSVNILIYK